MNGIPVECLNEDIVNLNAFRLSFSIITFTELTSNKCGEWESQNVISPTRNSAKNARENIALNNQYSNSDGADSLRLAIREFSIFNVMGCLESVARVELFLRPLIKFFTINVFEIVNGFSFLHCNINVRPLSVEAMVVAAWPRTDER